MCSKWDTRLWDLSVHKIPTYLVLRPSKWGPLASGQTLSPKPMSCLMPQAKGGKRGYKKSKTHELDRGMSGFQGFCTQAIFLCRQARVHRQAPSFQIFGFNKREPHETSFAARHAVNTLACKQEHRDCHKVAEYTLSPKTPKL